MDEKEKTAHRREMLVRLVNEKKLREDVRIKVTYLDKGVMARGETREGGERRCFPI